MALVSSGGPEGRSGDFRVCLTQPVPQLGRDIVLQAQMDLGISQFRQKQAARSRKPGHTLAYHSTVTEPRSWALSAATVSLLQCQSGDCVARDMHVSPVQ